MKKFPGWLVIIALLSLFPYFAFIIMNPDDSLIINIITTPLIILISLFVTGGVGLAIAYLVTVAIRIYFISKLMYGLFHKFNIKINDKAKYVLSSMLAVSAFVFFISLGVVNQHLTGF